MADSEFTKNVRAKREAARRERLDAVLALLKSGEDVPFAHFSFELQAYHIDGQAGLWTLVNCPSGRTVRAFSMWESDWRHFVPVSESRMVSIADRLLEDIERPF
jgi:hypothetical protein